jgi:hypothetical protein
MNNIYVLLCFIKYRLYHIIIILNGNERTKPVLLEHIVKAAITEATTTRGLHVIM